MHRLDEALNVEDGILDALMAQPRHTSEVFVSFLDYRRLRGSLGRTVEFKDDGIRIPGAYGWVVVHPVSHLDEGQVEFE